MGPSGRVKSSGAAAEPSFGMTVDFTRPGTQTAIERKEGLNLEFAVRMILWNTALFGVCVS